MQKQVPVKRSDLVMSATSGFVMYSCIIPDYFG